VTKIEEKKMSMHSVIWGEGRKQRFRRTDRMKEGKVETTIVKKRSSKGIYSKIRLDRARGVNIRKRGAGKGNGDKATGGKEAGGVFLSESFGREKMRWGRKLPPQKGGAGRGRIR